MPIFYIFIPTFYSYFKESFGGECHMYHSFHCTHVITLSKLQLKQRCRLMKAIAEMKLDTGQARRFEQLYKVGSECELNSWPDNLVV